MNLNDRLLFYYYACRIFSQTSAVKVALREGKRFQLNPTVAIFISSLASDPCSLYLPSRTVFYLYLLFYKKERKNLERRHPYLK